MKIVPGGTFVLLLLVAASCAPAKGAPPSSPPSPSTSSGAATPNAPTESKSADESAAPSGDKSSPEVDRAIAAIKAGDYRSAKAGLEQAVRKNPKNGTASYYLGVVLENLGDKPGAEQRYKDAMTYAPDIVEAAINLGAIYLDASKWDEANAITQKGLAKRPDDPALHANMAVGLRGKGDKEGAAVEYERAVKVVGDNADLRFGYASLLLELGNKPKATTELRAAMGAAASNRAMLASIGRLFGSAGAFADCVAALDKAIALGDDAELRVRRGLCRHSLKDEPGARADFEGAIKQDAKYAPAHYYLGEAWLSSGDAPKAAKEFDLAATSAPQSELGKKAKEKADAARKGAKRK